MDPEDKRALLDRIVDLKSRLGDYPPKEHVAGVIDQNYGSGVVPLRHAMWVLVNTERRLIDETHHEHEIGLEISFVVGVMFSFGLLTREELGGDL